ncbi:MULTISPECIES: signal recognition particle-docking protein FtsY [Citrobacter]|uniref:signal recognition particle-docking protein FtsY n=1 Tax=Citrobacter TaxID=544 RepID=UPI000F8D16F9|nr:MULTISPECIES: signal recognition particle-docking protein FtsY [Citrobacter]EHU7374218.1 signal recognition particle-docking protein FtsY [Citrobacter freundii]MDG9956892.1 signal recognition particle-docking protein FtsY [Citrobacter portucalensis]MDM2812707.1 signal recognition particle-docking protein FtsY [Citrobacter sp. Cpo103]MEB0787727.1 signal recognition particle-docking protein FtsY [Citrobacter portucalensis]MEB0874686.1 signal recognition particle-docking protein FtsY [Citrobac
MAKEKKRGFFSWLGFGQKEQAPENETEVKNEEQQPVAEETTVVDEQPHVEETRSEAETQAFAAEVVEVTEQVAEIEKLQQEEEPVAEQAQPEIESVAESVAETVVETPAAVVIEREELPLPEEVKTEEVTAEEWQAEAETVEIVEAAEEAVMVVPVEEPAVEEPVEEEVVQEQEKPTKEGFFARLKRSLLKTKENLGSGFISLFRGKKIDDDLFEELEEQLLIADVGVETTRKIIANLTEGASRKQLKDAEALYGLLKEEMGEILAKVDEPLNVDGKTPFVILMVGVNGVGKTTTIGKLARQFEQQGKSVMLAAGDTFRAAAVEQLQVWGQRNNIPVIAQHTGADSASVIFDAIQAAKARNVDVLIADTAGRLQNKSHLMEELKKIVRVMKKLDEDAPHEVMLTIDASTGQNAISQAKLFHEAVGLTGITLTKLDGTAKGGVIFSVADQFGIPIRYIGVGERIEDLRPFKADDFIEALFARED